METIKLVRLNNGEDIVAYVEEIDDHLLIRDPMTVVILKNNKAGKQTIVMSEYIPYPIIKSNEIILNQADVFFVMEPSDAFSEYYFNMLNRSEIAETEDLSDESDDKQMKIMSELIIAKETNQIH